MKKGFLKLALLAFGFLSLLMGTAQAGEETFGSPAIRTWVRTNSHNQPTSLGFRATATALDDLTQMQQSGNESPEVVLPFPHRPDLPFTHLYLVWEPHGHDPAEIYGVPHWDVHFYIISNQAREAITCSGADEARCMKQPVAAAIPSNYGKTPEAVPKMGWHWVDLLSPEFHGRPFTSTMVYGYYNGELAFLEPMIAKSYLDNRPQYAAAIRQPMIYPRPGYYPNAYSVKYLAPTDEYEVSLNHLVYRH